MADGKVHTGVLNDDGSVTYTMSKAQHAALLESIAAELRSTLDDMIGPTDYPNLTRIETNDDFTDFTVYTTTQPGAVGLSDYESEGRGFESLPAHQNSRVLSLFL